MPRTADRPSGALVTGASSGIGRATALRLADLGIPVVLTGRSADALEAVAEECRARGGTASVVEVDVRDEDAVTSAVSDAADAHGRDVAVVHSAAVVAYGLFEEVPSADLADTVATITQSGRSRIALVADSRICSMCSLIELSFSM